MLTLDYSLMLSDAVDGGVALTDWTSAAATFATAWDQVAALRASGALGFFGLPTDTALLAQTTTIVARTRGRYRDIVLLGIGGSALGPAALRSALRPPQWNLLPDEAREGWPRLHVLDNIDPVTVAATIARVRPAETLFLVISKSGGTAETMAQYLIVRGRLEELGLPLAEHLVFITDPSTGALRPIASAEGIPALDIPPDVGGRFSVLTPVGMLPSALIGIDVAAILAGAAAMAALAESRDVTRNPAGAWAVLQWLADTRAGRPIHVMMPYADSLRDVASWFVQLWAESLGKVRPDGAHTGPTPVPAVGATDQHAQVQLFMEGPQDKTLTFIAVREPAVDITIPSLHADIPDLAYLGGHDLWQLLNFERRATAGALAARGRPSATIELDRVDEWHLGAILMFLELATAYAGALYGIDAFNQPGVELGKRFTYGMMGRPGFEEARAEFEKLPGSNRSRRIGPD